MVTAIIVSSLRKFQSHNGAIAAGKGPGLQSIGGSGFQSHNGAIAARYVLVFERFRPKFQSHNGAIAACRISHHRLSTSFGFNPTMVRLLHSPM